MKRPNLSRRDRRAVALGAALLAPALFWTLAVSPYLDALGAANERLASERSLLRREQELVASAREYPKAFDAGAERLLRAAPRLMGGENDGAASAAVAGYVRRLAGIASAHLTRVEPGASRAAGGGVTALPVAVTGESDLEGLLSFLQMLETGPKLVDVDDLRLEASDAPGAVGATYSATPFFTPSTAQPEVIHFQFTVTGFTLAAPEARGPPRPATTQDERPEA
ncbi:MAG TPA: type II secretion system protein GspM [Longimicrobium sp.]|nr:type II secretion system protein GspM [Longimicrobium sp.]